MGRTLILGGCGFIGLHLARAIAREGGSEVVLVDNLLRGQFDQAVLELLASYPLVRLQQADLSDEKSFDQLGTGFQQVFLLAASVGVRTALENPTFVLRNNSLIVLNTMEWLSNSACELVVFASSSEVYAGAVTAGTASVPTDELVAATILDPLEPRWSYAISKMLGEGTVAQYSRKLGIPSIIVRYHNVYGPRMGQEHVVPDLMQRVHARKDPLRVYGTDHTRTFCYVEDAVAATRALAAQPPERCEIVNIGDDQEEVRIGDLLEKILSITDFHPKLEVLDPMDGSVPRRCPDISKLKRSTSFEPQWSLDAGLAETWQWYRNYFDESSKVGAKVSN